MVPGLDEREHLLAEEPHVLGEDVDLLERAVVEIEAEPDEQPLVCRRQARLVPGCIGLARDRAAHLLNGVFTPIRR